MNILPVTALVILSAADSCRCRLRRTEPCWRWKLRAGLAPAITRTIASCSNTCIHTLLLLLLTALPPSNQNTMFPLQRLCHYTNVSDQFLTSGMSVFSSCKVMKSSQIGRGLQLQSDILIGHSSVFIPSEHFGLYLHNFLLSLFLYTQSSYINHHNNIHNAKSHKLFVSEFASNNYTIENDVLLNILQWLVCHYW